MTNSLLKKYAVKAMQGFTLIETLMAVLLLTMAIVGPLSIAAKGLSSSILAKDQIGAFNLAEDAVEYVRFARDTNKLSGGDWLAGTGGGSNVVNLTACEASTGCYIDTIQSTVTACGTTCPIINYDSANHFYSYTSGTPSPQRYLRTIGITTPVGSNAGEASVVVTVQWTSAGGLTHSVTVHEDIFNWQ